ncbi:MAG: DUF6232 family protein [Hyphomicrobiales bacterium]|nr:DUF6232 family protein [Hyphomicrobiales bacterium]
MNDAASGDSKTQTYDFMSVKHNVIDMGYRSIAIANIASITVIRKSSAVVKRALIVAALASFVAAYIGLPGFYIGLPGFSAPIFGVLGLILFAATFFIPKRWFLTISTCDGGLSMFYSGDANLLLGVKKALDEKIDEPQSDSGFTVNFNEGSVKGITIEKVEEIKELRADMMVSESPGAMVAANSPNAQVGLGANITNTITETVTNTTISFVDYERFIPGVEQFRNYLAEKRSNPAIEAKLDEMLELMRQGTGDDQQKGRLRDLALELTQYVQAYQPLRDLFTGIVSAIS